MEQKTAVICGYCDRERGVQECLYDHVVINGVEYQRVRVVESPFYEGEPNCECGCDIGQVHHVGCDLEDCPRCGGQFLSCLLDGEGDGCCNVKEFIYYEMHDLQGSLELSQEQSTSGRR